MGVQIAALIFGLIVLIWSADRFVQGATALSLHLKMPPLLIGMVVIGFGTSAPELSVSAFAALQGNSGIALGNAYGSNIANIALILGTTAIIRPIYVQSAILKKELPILLAITLVSLVLIADLNLSKAEAVALLLILCGLMGWTIKTGLTRQKDTLSDDVESETAAMSMTIQAALAWLALGLVLLIGSSRILVWGASQLAMMWGVSDTVIGLSIIAIGTSLPELAASVMSALKGESDLALGNVLGSNLFNTLAVVGLAGVIHPFGISSQILTRDFPLMTCLTLVLFIICYGFRGRPGRINRFEGAFLLSIYGGYIGFLILTAGG